MGRKPLMSTEENQPIEYKDDHNYLYNPDDTWDDLDEALISRIFVDTTHPIHSTFTDEDRNDPKRMRGKIRRWVWNRSADESNTEEYHPGRVAVKKPINTNLSHIPTNNKSNQFTKLKNGTIVPKINSMSDSYKDWYLNKRKLKGNRNHKTSITDQYYQEHFGIKKPNKPPFDPNKFKMPGLDISFDLDLYNRDILAISDEVKSNYKDLIEGYYKQIQTKNKPTYNQYIAYVNRDKLFLNDDTNNGKMPEYNKRH